MAGRTNQTGNIAVASAIGGWFAGLAVFNWYPPSPPHVSVIGHIILIVVGTLLAGLVIGAIARMAERAIGNAIVGAVIGAVLGLFAAWPAVILMARILG